VESARNKLVAPLNHRSPERYERFCRALEQRARGEHRGGRLANLLEQAIQCNDGDHAAKIIQHALGIESDDVANYVFPLAARPGAACPHHWGMAIN